MNLGIIDISNNFTVSTLNRHALSTSKAGHSFADIFRNSIKESSLTAGSPTCTEAQLASDSVTDTIDQLASESENKYCSMCGSRIKEDGTCPICIVPIFISGNSGSRSQGASQADNIHSIAGNRVTLSYNRRKI